MNLQNYRYIIIILSILCVVFFLAGAAFTIAAIVQKYKIWVGLALIFANLGVGTWNTYRLTFRKYKEILLQVSATGNSGGTEPINLPTMHTQP